MNPNKQQFTYRECSRIDKFLVSESCTEYIQKSNILIAGIKTDHKCIEIKLNLANTCRGPGRWKLNVDILNDKLYTEVIKKLIKTVKENYSTLSKQLLWEICKIKIKEKTICYCKQKSKIKKDLMKELETNIQLKEDELIKNNYNRKTILERDCLADELHRLVQKQNVGAQIRSRAKWVEEGEVSSKFFLNLENKNVNNNTIKCLKKDDGSYTKTEDEILIEQHNFYKKLYQRDKISETNMNQYLQNMKKHTTLNDEEKLLLEGNINESECVAALNLMKLNKSPGSDGLPVEFYKSFWTDIKIPLLDSLQEAYTSGELSTTQKRGIITLLHKKNDKTLLNNWRPISLLNTDYKILTHVLANRMKKVINTLISSDQTGYIKGRFIGQNIRVIQDVIELLEEEKTEGAILFLDFKKAFDTVSHTFLLKTLQHFNFGDSFITWVKVIYKNAESCVTNNGWLTQPIEIQRGIRQGCPLSALLFLLIVEILALKIKEDKEDGLEIKVGNNSKEYLQISQLADDTTLILKNEAAVINSMAKVKLFGKISGLRINLEKTEGLWLGRGANRQDNLAGINWNKEVVKALGVYFGYNKNEIEVKNWQTKLDNIKSILTKWSIRDLTFQGRVQIIKSLALSQIVHLLSSLHVPNWLINEVNKEFFKFLWKNKRDKICRKVMVNDIQSGGVNMVDVKSFHMALKASWAGRLWHKQTETWTAIPRMYMKNCDINMLMCMNFEKDKQIPIKTTEFYKEVLLAWHLCGGGLKAPQNANEIRQQLLWGNKYIQSRGKTLLMDNWKKSNINFIEDILSKNGNFKSAEEIFNILKNKRNWLIEYHIIIKSIPKLWKDKLKEADMATKVKTELTPYLIDNGKRIFKIPIRSKDYYQLLIKSVKQKSYNENYRNKVFYDRPFWNSIWTNRVKYQKNKKLADFNFKILHRVLPCGENLYNWKITNSNTCRFGCNTTETYEHMFVKCPRLINVYNKIENILSQLKLNIQITYPLLIFGYKINYNCYSQVNTLLSHIFFSVYKHWLRNEPDMTISQSVYQELTWWNQIYKEGEKNANFFNSFLKKW